jgi:hypothetical protein
MAGKQTRPGSVSRARRLVQAAGLIFYVLAGQALLTSGVGAHVFLSEGGGSDLLLPVLSLVLAGCYALVGFHLRRYRAWAKNFAFAFAAVSLFAFPVGTALGVLVALLIEPAHRARLFLPAWPRIAAPAIPRLSEAEMPVLRFDPKLVAEVSG